MPAIPDMEKSVTDAGEGEPTNVSFWDFTALPAQPRTSDAATRIR